MYIYVYSSGFFSEYINMAQENVVRRHKGNQSQNGDVKREAKPPEPEFIPRESPLTILIQNSLHIRAIYHIFVAILIILLLDTAIYDLVESGKQVNI